MASGTGPCPVQGAHKHPLAVPPLASPHGQDPCHLRDTSGHTAVSTHSLHFGVSRTPHTHTLTKQNLPSGVDTHLGHAQATQAVTVPPGQVL
jgi:hypothetical protein